MNDTAISESCSGRDILNRNVKSGPDSTTENNIFLLCSVLYLLLSTTRIFSFWKEQLNIYNVNVDQVAVDPISVVLGNFLGLYMLVQFARRKADLMRIVRENRGIFFLFFLSLISCIWSQLPFVAFKRWLKIFYFLLIVLNIISSTDPIHTLKKIVWIYTKVIVSISLLFILFIPEFGWMTLQGEYLAKGIFTHKNALANASALVILLIVWVEYYYRKSPRQILWQNWFWICGSLLCLFLSKGKTSLGGFLIAIFLYLAILIVPGRKKQDSRMVVSLLFLLTSVILLPEILFGVNMYELIMSYALNAAGKDPTFTGRTQIWIALINLGIENHPILGSGYQSFFLGDRSLWLLNYFDWNATDSHNSFIQIFLELGAVGVISSICILISLIMAVYQKIFTSGNQKDILTFSIIIFLLFCGMFEANLSMVNTLAFFSFLVIVFFKNAEIPDIPSGFHSNCK